MSSLWTSSTECILFRRPKLVQSVPHEHETVGGCRDLAGLQQPDYVVHVAGAICDVEPDVKPDERSNVHAPVRLRVHVSTLRAAA
jgi:hypothetical protein